MIHCLAVAPTVSPNATHMTGQSPECDLGPVNVVDGVGWRGLGKLTNVVGDGIAPAPVGQPCQDCVHRYEFGDAANTVQRLGPDQSSPWSPPPAIPAVRKGSVVVLENGIVRVRGKDLDGK